MTHVQWRAVGRIEIQQRFAGQIEHHIDSFAFAELIADVDRIEGARLIDVLLQLQQRLLIVNSVENCSQKNNG